MYWAMLCIQFLLRFLYTLFQRVLLFYVVFIHYVNYEQLRHMGYILKDVAFVF